MVRTLQHMGSIESRYRAFQLAHEDGQRFLFPLLLGALLAIWAVSMIAVVPLGGPSTGIKGFGLHSPGGYLNAGHMACRQKLKQKDPSKTLAEAV